MGLFDSVSDLFSDFPLSDLIVSAIPSVVGGVGDYITADEDREYKEKLTEEDRAYQDKVRAEQYARADKSQALALQLEAIKAKYAPNPYLGRMILSPGEALATKSRDFDRRQDAIKTLIAAVQNPLLSRA